MPLILPNGLIDRDILKEEKIFTMTRERAASQDIRPLKIAIVNLMPKKEVTELQFIRMLSNTALQLDIDLVRMESYNPKNTDSAHLHKFYKTYEEIKDKKYDAMIITGAPVEKLDYDTIKYWKELNDIFDFAKKNVYSTMFICWSAQAALYYYYNVDCEILDEKIFGVYGFYKKEDDNLLKGFDDEFFIPQSRYTKINTKILKDIEELKVLCESEETGVVLAKTKDERFIFNFGHFEYDKETLHEEYLRDLTKSLKINIPKNYYKNDDPNSDILVKWRASANLFFSNWLNYSVYQETPFDIYNISKKSVSKFGGTSLSDAKQFSKVRNIIFSKEDRDVIVVSAPGKRNDRDEKVTDILIKVSELSKDLENLREVIKRLSSETLIKENLLKDNLELVKDRFEKIRIDLNLDEALEEKIEEVFNEIKNSTNKDFIISRGEYLNGLLMAQYLNYEFVDAKDLIFFKRNGKVDFNKSTKAIAKKITKGKKVVVPGFYGNYFGEIKTFNRGGSDYTGSIIAYALNSEIYENWTDVNGIMTKDPKKDKDAKTIEKLSYKELSDIIEGGAEVYQKEALEPVALKNIKVRILNTNDPKNKGTEIED